MLTDDLLAYLFDGKPHLLLPPMTEWLTSSRRFTTFVKTFQDKIRKKIRVTEDPDTLLDLRLEFGAAYLLLRERTLNLVYEPQLAEKVRSPDFAVSFTTSLTFMLEVTRLRSERNEMPVDAPNTIAERLIDTVCSKLGQLVPQNSNILLIGMDAPQLTENELRSAMIRLQQRAEQSPVANTSRQEPDFFQRYRFRDRADFFSQYQRLSEILVRGTAFRQSDALITWVNPQARYPLPGKVRTSLYRALAP